TETQQWEQTVAGLPAEKQVEEVSQRLQELNPGFDGKVTPTVQEGVVKGLEFSTANVSDISPLRALRGLEALKMSGDWPTEGKLSDLSPLRGLALKSLVCGGNPITDLPPPPGRPLKGLRCASTHVSNLTPLKGPPLETPHIHP